MAEYLEDQAKSREDGKKLREQGKAWLARIAAAEKLEKDWIKDAEAAEAGYTGDKGGARSAKLYDYNMLFANVETIVPAIINSPPQPDIRRRFGDDDPVAKDVAEIIERVIRLSVDDSRLQNEMESSAQDTFLAGRGLVRLRFHADVTSGGDLDEEDVEELAEKALDDRTGAPDVADDEDAEAEVDETVTNEHFGFEVVSWRDYRHGPAKRWDQRPWEAFRHSFAVEDIGDFADRTLVASQTDADDEQSGDADGTEVTVWEIWDARSRKVFFVEDVTGKVLKVVPDPLELVDFYSICTPMQPITLTAKLTPVNPFSIYKKLAEEVDTTTKRINILTKALKVKGWYAGDANDMNAILSADDNDFVPITNGEVWAQHGGLAGAVAFWPIEKIVLVLRELYANREQTKQAIFEITGISDIVRGASKATETATAQSIKNQWGSLRIQKMQRMIEGAARELFVKMEQVIGKKFSAKTLEEMTGVQLVPKEADLTPIMPQIVDGMAPEQMQQARDQAMEAETARQKRLAHIEAVNELLTNGLGRAYRVDVESDSTVRADLTQKKSEQAEFLQATASYFAAAAPMVQNGAMSKEGALEIYAATARLFTLGKSTEDTLEREITKAREQAERAANQPPQPSPAEVEAQAKRAEAEQKATHQAAQNQHDQAQWAHEERMSGIDAQIKGMDLMAARAKLQESGVHMGPNGTMMTKQDAEAQVLGQALASLQNSMAALANSQAEANAMFGQVLAAIGQQRVA